MSVKKILVVGTFSDRLPELRDELASLYPEAEFKFVLDARYAARVEKFGDRFEVIKKGSLTEIFRGRHEPRVRRWADWVNDLDPAAVLIPEKRLGGWRNKYFSYLLAFPYLNPPLRLIAPGGREKPVGWKIYAGAIWFEFKQRYLRPTGEHSLSLLLLPVNVVVYLLYFLLYRFFDVY